MNLKNKWIKRGEKAYVLSAMAAVFVFPLALYINMVQLVFVFLWICVAIVAIGAFCITFGLIK